MNTQRINNLLKRKWYFQGFNGTPALLYGPARSMVKDMPEFLGYGYTAWVAYFRNDVCYFLYAWDDLRDILKELLKRYKKDKKYLSYLIKEDKKVCAYTKKEFQAMDKKNWKKLSTAELFKLWRRAYELSAHSFQVSHLIEGFTLTTETEIRDLIAREFPSDSFGKTILLTTPSRHSFMTTEHYELCLIAQKIQEKKLRTTKMIEAHQQKYFWKLNSFTCAKKLTAKDFTKETEDLLKKKTDVTKFISDYESLDDKIKEKDKIIKKIKNKKLVDLLLVADALFDIHDRRKEYITWVLNYTDFILKEIAGRFKLDIQDLRYISPMEFEKLPSLAKELHRRRVEGSVYIYFPPGDELLVFSGSRANKYFSQLERQNKAISSKEIKGVCASPGEVIGIVKVCRGESEIGKMKEGDILVACMTQPEFLPAMKKAKAIITDEGGLTCHAAIIARELGIPCVIGTKIATQVLKDGDEVEVDANHGVVTIL